MELAVTVDYQHRDSKVLSLYSDYFKNLFEEMGIPYQSLINLYLRDHI